ncbi:MAG: hypothetical protein ACLU62_05110 [Hydrogeniiclostridium sp.]
MAQAERTLSYISLNFRFVDRKSDVQKGSFAELETCLGREKRLEKNHLNCSAFSGGKVIGNMHVWSGLRKWKRV